MCQAQISDSDPQSGQVVKKFSSNKEEDAQNIRHYIDGILGQMSRNAFDQQEADQGVQEEEGNPEEAQLWGRYWGRGRYGRYGGYGGRWGYGRYGGYGGYGGCDLCLNKVAPKVTSFPLFGG
ncbi:hypothetical protein K493DRAFT_316656, partial [Basidiobolus meristosporus CBS 931.73]